MSYEYASTTERIVCTGTGIVVGEGQSGYVLTYDEHPHVVFKVPHGNGSDDLEILFLEKGRHTVIRELGLNTLGMYDVVELVSSGDDIGRERYAGRMSDLTAGGSRFVFSVQDAYRYSRQYMTPYPVENRPRGTVVNAAAFFHQLEQQVRITQTASININGAQIDGIKLETPGMFIVVREVEPGKLQLETVVADFHDGQTFGTSARVEPEFNPERPEYYESIRHYLAWVARFYPDLTVQADAFLSQLSNGLSSLK